MPKYFVSLLSILTFTEVITPLKYRAIILDIFFFRYVPGPRFMHVVKQRVLAQV